MAASQAPTALKYPAQGEPNAFSAAFYENQAKLEFQEKNALAADTRERSNAESTYAYNRGLNTRAEPLRLTANRNQANTAGLAESGVLAKTQGQTQTDYAQKDARLAEGRRQAIERINANENTTKGNYALETNKDIRAENERIVNEQKTNPASPIGSTAANPGGSRAVLGPPGAGGVVPYVETSPAGSVTVGTNRAQAQQKLGTFQWSRNPRVRAEQQRQLASKQAVG